MAISYRKHNKEWEYRITYQDPITKKRKEKSRRGFSTKPEARLAAQEMEQKLLSGLELTEDILIRDYLPTWLEEYKAGVVRKNTYQIHNRNIEKHLIPYFKKMKLRELKPITYQKFLNYLVDLGYSRRTVQIIHGTMRSAMERAKINQKIEFNPCDGAEIKTQKKRRSSKEELPYVTSDRVTDLLSAAYEYGYIYYVIFKILVETGMRKGEAAGLQWTDINLKEKTIKITNTLHFDAKNEEELFGDTKTYTSQRTIGIDDDLVKTLQFHIKWQNQNKLALSEKYAHNLNLVCCRTDGTHLTKSTLFNAFSRILKRAGIDPLPIHGLRHTHAVMLLEAGASMKYIQERLGHKSMEITSDVYSHISKKLESQTLDMYEEYKKKLRK
ncbi:tyrosine-type recombinase/integrase [Terribacillus saccharophilus]|uniref:tyrosine-type recombinase/integrase n=1 Tax=Terribacillus saccharophilus TaxID=361277 RepID=UPI000C9C7DEC|nr:tyrosine-type recombinase/integrase [Terribacillus goriensis]